MRGPDKKVKGEGKITFTTRLKGGFICMLILAIFIYIVRGNITPIGSAISMTFWLALISYIWGWLEQQITKGASAFDKILTLAVGLVGKAKEYTSK